MELFDYGTWRRKSRTGSFFSRTSLQLYTCRWVKDGVRVLACYGAIAQIWDVATRKSITGLFSGPREAALNGDGNQLHQDNCICTFRRIFADVECRYGIAIRRALFSFSPGNIVGRVAVSRNGKNVAFDSIFYLRVGLTGIRFSQYWCRTLHRESRDQWKRKIWFL